MHRNLQKLKTNMWFDVHFSEEQNEKVGNDSIYRVRELINVIRWE